MNQTPGSDPIWDNYCAMTCVRGSDDKDCPCVGPRDCQMQDHPDFKHRRMLARARMNIWLRQMLRKKGTGRQ